LEQQLSLLRRAQAEASAATETRVAELEEEVSALRRVKAEGEEAGALRVRVRDLEQQLGLMRRGREEDVEERGRLRGEVGRAREEGERAVAAARAEVRGGEERRGWLCGGLVCVCVCVTHTRQRPAG
jgi:hypothetical protein